MVDTLGNRIKIKYENVFRATLPQRSYVIVRIDGKAFHTFTKKLPKPVSQPLVAALDAAAQVLCKEMMGCRLAYGQSDEYSFLLTDFDTDDTEMWFNGNIQKITSVSSSIFTATFNQEWARQGAEVKLGHFDSRTFIIPDRRDVLRYFQWRQADASRNSLNMLASCHFTHKELMGAGADVKHEMLHSKGVNWSKQPTSFKRGRVVRKVSQDRTVSFTHKKTQKLQTVQIQESVWAVDNEIPVFGRQAAYLDDIVPNLK